MSPGVSKTAIQLRISLKEYVPVIWRRLLVPGGVTMAKLRAIFQAAMGWDDYHLHCFEIDGVRYGIPDPEFEMTEIDDETVRLSELMGERARFEYQYDFGDNWRHEVIIESVSVLDLVLKNAVCLEGQRACPPEDIGGTHMYSVVLEAIRDPDHEEHDEYLNWIAPGFDPDAFDLGPSTPLCSECADQAAVCARFDVLEILVALGERVTLVADLVVPSTALRVSSST